MHKALALVISIAGLAAPAWACRCPPQTPASAYRMADAALLVRVESGKDASRYRRVYRIAVERAWKRMPLRPEIATRRTSCMLNLKPGTRYLVFVTIDGDGSAESTACSGSLPFDRAGAAIGWLEANGKAAR